MIMEINWERNHLQLFDGKHPWWLDFPDHECDKRVWQKWKFRDSDIDPSNLRCSLVDAKTKRVCWVLVGMNQNPGTHGTIEVLASLVVRASDGKCKVMLKYVKDLDQNGLFEPFKIRSL